MTFTAGTKLGSYEITGPLGAGGMGEVYRARDSKLKRDVAIKVLPQALAHDAERLARFQREAEALASLNHPSIGSIYDLGEAGESRFLVLELVEGETLADRIARGPLPLDEAVNAARQIAEAIEAAHERGIIHRDLKPANIKLSPEGKVKVLDFGLAKVRETDGVRAELSQSPTMMPSETGVILGTAAYMSPEQARGKAIDKRTDIWAFGCVLYEMLTGRHLFKGSDVSETIAAILRDTPDFREIAPPLPLRITTLLRRCLEKDPSKRLRDIGEARIALESPTAADADETAGTLPIKYRNHPLAWALFGAALILAVALSFPAIRHLRETPVDAPLMQLEISTPATSSPLHFAISPDGTHLTFVASGNGAPRLWVRALDKVAAQALAGTEGAELPFWSPDSRSIGFFAQGKLKRVAIGGGPAQTLAPAPSGWGGTWNRDDVILFSPTGVSGINRISASSGDATRVTHLAPGQSSHRAARFLPDGRHFLYFVQGGPEQQGIYLASLDGGESRRLIANDTPGAWAPPNRVLFVRQGALLSQSFDIDKAQTIGDTVTVADSVGSDVVQSGSGFSVSTTGIVAYRNGDSGLRRLLWFDRSGKPVGAIGEADPASPLFPELSPDDRRITLNRTTDGNPDIWLIDALTGGGSRFTLEPSNESAPLFSPDGSQIVFQSNRDGAYNLYLKAAAGGREAPLPLDFPGSKEGAKAGNSWSSDGKILLFRNADAKTGYDLWAMPMKGDGKSLPIANTPASETNGQFSPDGRWIAYQSNETGRDEIYIQPFPPTGAMWPVSANGGTMPRWRTDGKEVFFIAADLKMMAAAITVSGQTVAAAPPTALFQTRIVTALGQIKHQYTVARDGRFLINTAEESSGSPITLILNWKAGN